MEQLLILLLIAILVLALVGLVTVIRGFVRLLSGEPGARSPEKLAQCPYCDQWNRPSLERCDRCGRPLRSGVAAELADLKAMRRQVRRMVESGTLDPKLAGDVLARVEECSRRLVQPAEAVPRAAPPAAPVVVVPEAPRPLPPQPAPAQPAPAAPKPKVKVPAAAAAPVAPRPPTPPPPPKKPWSDLIVEFLEEHNLRLGTVIGVLVGGILIVGASVALAISFRAQLERIPYWQFLIFVAFSSAVFGLGLGCVHRWKLEAVGQPMLVIATLLVPVGFLVTATFFGETWHWRTAAVEAAGLAVFIFLVGKAAETLAPDGRWFQTVAVVGNSLAVLIVARLTGPDPTTRLMTAALPVAVYCVSVGAYLFQVSARKGLESARLDSLFTLLGTATFSVAVPLGLLISLWVRTEDIQTVLRHAAPLLALVAVPVLSGGLTAMRGSMRDASLGPYHMAGSAVALVGLVGMIAALVMAWPDPRGIVLVGTFDAVALAYVAVRHRLPIAHAGAIASAAMVYLVGYHLAAGTLPWDAAEITGSEVLGILIGGRSGTALVPLSIVLGLAAELLARLGFHRHAIQYVGGCAAVAAVSVLLVTNHGRVSGGLGAIDPTVVYGVYGLGGLAIAARWRRKEFSYLGLALLAGATGWALRYWLVDVSPQWAAIFAVESLVLTLAAAALSRLVGRPPSIPGIAPEPSPQAKPAHPLAGLIEAYRMPLWHAGEAVALLALVIGLGKAFADPGSPAHAVTAVCLAVTGFVLAWGYRSSVLAGITSVLVLLGLVHALAFNYRDLIAYPDLVASPYVVACFLHATLAVLASAALRAAGRWLAGETTRAAVQSVFVEPLEATALVSSTGGLLFLIYGPGKDFVWPAACLFWLSAIWMLVAWVRGVPLLLAAAQAVLTAAVATATTAWLDHHPWSAGGRLDVADPRSLQTYGIALGLLTLAWLAVRIPLRRSALAGRLLEPGWPTVDRVVGHAVAAAQLLLLAWCSVPTCLGELVRRFGPTPAMLLDAFGPNAWWLLGVLACCALVSLWSRWGEAELTRALLVAAAVPYLVAGPAVADRSAATALRWCLAIGCAIGSAAIWYRRPLKEAALRIGAVISVGRLGPRIARAALVLTAVLPILVLTVLAALLHLAGEPPVRPGGGLFAPLDPQVSYLVPLVVVIATLVGLAAREGSPGYAFSAGLVAKLTVVLAYLLALASAGRTFGLDDLAAVLQLATITAAAWAAAWLTARQWIERNPQAVPQVAASPRGRWLWGVQLALGWTGNTLLVVPALVILALSGPAGHKWTVAAGSPLGWLALVSMAAVAGYRRLEARRQLPPSAAGLIGMAVLGLLACSVRGLLPEAPEWGYRTLMLGWAAYSLFVVLATWWVASQRTLPDAQGPPQGLIRAAAGWCTAAGLLAVLLGLKAAFLHDNYEEILWGAAAIAVASTAAAAMAVWRRREGWAFAAAPGVNLAASLVVWYFQWYARHQITFEEWWVLLVQANVIASAAVALVWLAARRRLYQLRELSLRASPMLAVQTALGVVATAVLLIPVVVGVVQSPDPLPAWTTQLASPAGWLALVLAMGAAAWYLLEISPQDVFHAAGGLALGGGVLAMCLAARWTAAAGSGDWLPYHVLMSAWAAGGLILFALGRLGQDLRLSGRLGAVSMRSVGTSPDKRGDASDAQVSRTGVPPVRKAPGDPEDLRDAGATEFPGIPAGLVLGWVTLLGILALGLALIHAHHDPQGPWWSVRAILGVSLAAGLLAMWLRLPLYVCFSGLLVNVAGTVLWLAREPHLWQSLVQVNVICFGVAAVVWTLLGPLHRDGVPAFHVSGRRQPLAEVAAHAAMAILGILVVVLLTSDLLARPHPVIGRLDWIALGTTIVALVLGMWDRWARGSLPGLYLCGLVGVGLSLVARELGPRALCWAAGPELAVFALVALAAAWLLPKLKPLARPLRLPLDDLPEQAAWFPGVQAIVAVLAGGLAVWIAIDPAFDAVAHSWLVGLHGRIAGPLATLLLLAVALGTAGLCSARWRAAWQQAAMLLGLLVLSELGWALLDADISAPWLHRSVILMVAAVAVTLAAGLGLPRMLPPESDWLPVARRSTPALAGLALFLLAAVLVQEGALFKPGVGAAVALPAVIVVAVALAGLIVGCLVCALVPRLDPWGMSDRGRTVYVYAAEGLAGLMGLHLWLTEPHLFQLELMRNYWMLLVMGLAFAGALLSELFHRRGMPVLSEPLERTAVLLPAAPAIGFFLFYDNQGAWSPAGSSPAVWLLTAMVYTFFAVSKRKFRFAALAVLAANVGLWVFWDRLGLELFKHPQTYVIPFALCVLVAEYLNHDRLTGPQSTAARYLGLSAIYVSSSSEYLAAIGQSVWLPLVLILLSLGGVLVGIILRIRSFLYLGIVFLLLVIVTMIRYAYRDLRQTWILYVCCILLGAAIIGFFALFEKRRGQILAAVKRFKGWQS